MSYIDTRPTVGRIVHYYPVRKRENFPPEENEPESGPCAAIITTVYSELCVSLFVFAYGLAAPVARSSVMKQSDPAPGQEDSGRYWCWPPREA